MTSHESRTTTDHEEIRRWAEARGARPAAVKGTGSGSEPGMIRLDFPGYSGADSLQEISWDEWFRAFDDNDLALVYQDTTADGARSNFNKLIGRDTAEERAHGESHASRHSRSETAHSGRGSTSRTSTHTSTRSSAGHGESPTTKSAKRKSSASHKAGAKHAASKTTPRSASKSATSKRSASKRPRS